MPYNTKFHNCSAGSKPSLGPSASFYIVASGTYGNKPLTRLHSSFSRAPFRKSQDEDEDPRALTEEPKQRLGGFGTADATGEEVNPGVYQRHLDRDSSGQACFVRRTPT